MIGGEPNASPEVIPSGLSVTVGLTVSVPNASLEASAVGLSVTVELIVAVPKVSLVTVPSGVTVTVGDITAVPKASLVVIPSGVSVTVELIVNVPKASEEAIPLGLSVTVELTANVPNASLVDMLSGSEYSAGSCPTEFRIVAAITHASADEAVHCVVSVPGRAGSVEPPPAIPATPSFHLCVCPAPTVSVAAIVATT